MLSILVALAGCCVGFVVPQQPGQYYDAYNGQYNQWQPLAYGLPASQYEPSQYQSSQYQPPQYSSQYSSQYPSQYPSQYDPSLYPPTDYEPNFYTSYSSGYYYFPYVYAYPEFHKSDLYKPNPDYELTYYEAENLLQLYRIIRVVALFRTPPKSPKQITSLDVLLHRLSKQKLQEQIVELIYHLHGYKEVAELKHGYPGHTSDSFANDNARLLPSIQRALNALYLGDNRDGICTRRMELCEELRRLRRQANGLTVAKIEKELFEGYHVEMKPESKDLDEDVNIVVDDDDDEIPIEEFQLVMSEMNPAEIEAINELAIALELFLQQQKEAEAQQEKSQGEVGQLSPVASTTASPPLSSTPTTWFGSMFGKEKPSANGSQTAPNEPNSWVHEDVAENKSHDFDIDERFQGETSTQQPGTLSSVTPSKPFWMMETTIRPDSKEPEIDAYASEINQLFKEGPESRDLPEAVIEPPAKEAVKPPVDKQTDQQRPDVTTEEATSPNSTNVNDGLATLATTAKPDARSFVKGQVLDVLRLLEEAKGFTELKEHISNPDVDQLVDSLNNVEAGVRWSEMLTALQNLVVFKQLNSTERIVNVLEHWKKSAKGQLDNGYFDRTYGTFEDVEARGLMDEGGISDNATAERSPRIINIEQQAAPSTPVVEKPTIPETSPQKEEMPEKLEGATPNPL